MLGTNILIISCIGWIAISISATPIFIPTNNEFLENESYPHSDENYTTLYEHQLPSDHAESTSLSSEAPESDDENTQSTIPMSEESSVTEQGETEETTTESDAETENCSTIMDHTLTEAPDVSSNSTDKTETQSLTDELSVNDNDTTEDNVATAAVVEVNDDATPICEIPTESAQATQDEETTYSPGQEDANAIKSLLGKLIDKLDIPPVVLNKYRYITAMKSNDGSLYVPHNNKQSTRNHLAILLGFAEEIVSSQNALAQQEEDSDSTYSKDIPVEIENNKFLSTVSTDSNPVHLEQNQTDIDVIIPDDFTPNNVTGGEVENEGIDSLLNHTLTGDTGSDLVNSESILNSTYVNNETFSTELGRNAEENDMSTDDDGITSSSSLDESNDDIESEKMEAEINDDSNEPDEKDDEEINEEEDDENGDDEVNNEEEEDDDDEDDVESTPSMEHGETEKSTSETTEVEEVEEVETETTDKDPTEVNEDERENDDKR